MIFDYNKIEITPIENFKGGEKHIDAQMFFDGQTRILRARLIPGASIGLHTHETNSEVIYIIEGEGTVILDGEKSKLTSNCSHYCPKGHSHTLINDSDRDLQFFAVITEQ